MECTLNRPTCKRTLLNLKIPFTKDTCPLSEKPKCGLARRKCPLLPEDNECVITKVIDIAKAGGCGAILKSLQYSNDEGKIDTQCRKNKVVELPPCQKCKKGLSTSIKEGELRKSYRMEQSKLFSKSENKGSKRKKDSVELEQTARLMGKRQKDSLNVPDCSLSSRRPYPCSDCIQALLDCPLNETEYDSSKVYCKARAIKCPFLQVVDKCDDECLCSQVPEIDTGPECPFAPKPCPCPQLRCPLTQITNCPLVERLPKKNTITQPKCRCFCPLIPNPCTITPPRCKLHSSKIKCPLTFTPLCPELQCSCCLCDQCPTCQCSSCPSDNNCPLATSCTTISSKNKSPGQICPALVPSPLPPQCSCKPCPSCPCFESLLETNNSLSTQKSSPNLIKQQSKFGTMSQNRAQTNKTEPSKQLSSPKYNKNTNDNVQAVNQQFEFRKQLGEVKICNQDCCPQLTKINENLLGKPAEVIQADEVSEMRFTANNTKDIANEIPGTGVKEIISSLKLDRQIYNVAKKGLSKYTLINRNKFINIEKASEFSEPAYRNNKNNIGKKKFAEQDFTPMSSTLDSSLRHTKRINLKDKNMLPRATLYYPNIIESKKEEASTFCKSSYESRKNPFNCRLLGPNEHSFGIPPNLNKSQTEKTNVYGKQILNVDLSESGKKGKRLQKLKQNIDSSPYYQFLRDMASSDDEEIEEIPEAENNTICACEENCPFAPLQPIEKKSFHVPTCPQAKIHHPPKSPIIGQISCPFAPQSCPIGPICPFPINTEYDPKAPPLPKPKPVYCNCKSFQPACPLEDTPLPECPLDPIKPLCIKKSVCPFAPKPICPLAPPQCPELPLIQNCPLINQAPNLSCPYQNLTQKKCSCLPNEDSISDIFCSCSFPPQCDCCKCSCLCTPACSSTPCSPCNPPCPLASPSCCPAMCNTPCSPAPICSPCCLSLCSSPNLPQGTLPVSCPCCPCSDEDNATKCALSIPNCPCTSYKKESHCPLSEIFSSPKCPCYPESKPKCLLQCVEESQSGNVEYSKGLKACPKTMTNESELMQQNLKKNAVEGGSNLPSKTKCLLAQPPCPMTETLPAVIGKLPCNSYSEEYITFPKIEKPSETSPSANSNCIIEKLMSNTKDVDCPVKVGPCELFPEGHCPMDDLDLCECDFPLPPCAAPAQCGDVIAPLQYCYKEDCCMGLPLPPTYSPNHGKYDTGTYYKFSDLKPGFALTKHYVAMENEPAEMNFFQGFKERQHNNWSVIRSGKAYETCKKIQEQLKRRGPAEERGVQFEEGDNPPDIETQIILQNRESRTKRNAGILPKFVI